MKKILWWKILPQNKKYLTNKQWSCCVFFYLLRLLIYIWLSIWLMLYKIRKNNLKIFRCDYFISKKKIKLLFIWLSWIFLEKPKLIILFSYIIHDQLENSSFYNLGSCRFRGQLTMDIDWPRTIGHVLWPMSMLHDQCPWNIFYLKFAEKLSKNISVCP